MISEDDVCLLSNKKKHCNRHWLQCFFYKTLIAGFYDDLFGVFPRFLLYLVHIIGSATANRPLGDIRYYVSSNIFVIFVYPNKSIAMTDIRNPEKSSRKNPIAGIWRFYSDGFRSMTVGRWLWAMILVKVAILLFVFRLFFFPDILSENYDNDEERAAAVRSSLLDR